MWKVWSLRVSMTAHPAGLGGEEALCETKYQVKRLNRAQFWGRACDFVIMTNHFSFVLFDISR